MPQSILVTGAAGFIGAHLCAALARQGHRVLGCDHVSSTDPIASLRHARVTSLLRPHDVAYLDVDLRDPDAVRQTVAQWRPEVVFHLAAKPGVRDSIEAPLDYVGPNLIAFANLLDACHRHGVGHLLFASSSSVYGARSRAPFQEADRCDRPESFYAATKAANEVMAWAFTRTHGLQATALRLFTVYGPWGRPDMAYFSFAQRIRRGEPITLYAGGRLLRDFTFVDDVVEAMLRLARRGAVEPWEVFNVGHSQPHRVIDFVATLEQALGLRALTVDAPMQPGDVPMTCADPDRLRQAIGDLPQTPLAEGLERFVDWLALWDPLPGVTRANTADSSLAVTGR